MFCHIQTVLGCRSASCETGCATLNKVLAQNGSAKPRITNTCHETCITSAKRPKTVRMLQFRSGEDALLADLPRSFTQVKVGVWCCQY